ncbi:SWIM zinc finger family protein [Halomarina oriensis]|uniref:SWIM-type domain-containing protein n=1 Tax=Halomarina oriensis TaxID=671145 RepID=A0A6B0GXN5_9EURY|nr:SWIM zinc finger family protein [Halomarina oriensis]MWG36538.1 hypothetical protein [Halomarina oriensis]
MPELATRPDVASGFERRCLAALTSPMRVTDVAPDLYEVASESGNTYTVDVREQVCSCPQSTYRDIRCKHLVRVALVTADSTRPLTPLTLPAR